MTKFTIPCWWCGKAASTKEHKFKKTDLEREFGNGQYIGDNSVLKCINVEQKEVRSSTSKTVKFEKNLCQCCNNEKSKAIDNDYDRFIIFIKKNEQQIIESRSFLFSSVFGNNWVEGRDNLLRYYVKHICCRLASSNIPISPNMLNFLDGTEIIKHISFHLEIREDIIAMINRLESENIDSGCLWLGDMYLDTEVNEGSNIYTSFIGYRWLRMNYHYNQEQLNSCNNFTSNKVVLDVGFSVNPSDVPE